MTQPSSDDRSDLVERLREIIRGDGNLTPYLQDAFIEAATTIASLREELDKAREAFYEIANRASNMMDDDAADWMPSIYKIACEASGENPWPLLKAAGYTQETLTVSINEQTAAQKQEA